MTRNTPIRFGGIVITLSFWGLVLYALVSLVGSLIRTLYGAPPIPISADPQSYSYKWCVAQLAASQTQLDNRLLFQFQHMDNARKEAEVWHTWKQGWEADLQRDAEMCEKAGEPGLIRAFAELRGLASRLDTITQNMADAGEARQALQGQLKRLAGKS